MTGRRRTVTKVVIGGFLLVALYWFAVAVHGDAFAALVGSGFAACAAGTTWDFRRRSNPARTAGWGRPGTPS
jgi:O-antigen/teichoic acid export membrane protein